MDVRITQRVIDKIICFLLIVTNTLITSRSKLLLFLYFLISLDLNWYLRIDDEQYISNRYTNLA